MAKVANYRDHGFETPEDAQWAMFLNALDIPWEYRLRKQLYDGEMHTPTFHLPHSNAYMDIVQGADLGSGDLLSAQYRAAKLAVGTSAHVLLIAGTVEKYQPYLYVAKFTPQFWQEPFSIPSELAHTVNGVGLDYFHDQLVIVTYTQLKESEYAEDPYYGNRVPVEVRRSFSYEAYYLSDPQDPVYMDPRTEEFTPKPEYIDAISTAIEAQGNL